MKTTTICPNCHLGLADAEEYCPQCGQEFCINCAAPIDESALACASCGQEYELFCPQCDAPVAPSFESCPVCGLTFDQEQDSSTMSLACPKSDTDKKSSLSCPACGNLYFVDDGFCRECGQAFCPNCREAIDDQDEQCPFCEISLTIECPLCGFYLAIGTEMCPNCDALFPSVCPICLNQVPAGVTTCPRCLVTIDIIQRRSARTVTSLEIGGRLIRIVACPGCGHDFDPISGQCPTCQLLLCSQCQLVLNEGEVGCPRCGFQVQNDGSTKVCGDCQNVINNDTGECPNCQMVHCPECLNLIPEMAESCTACGIQFEYLCPNCDSEVTSDAEICHNCGASV